MKTVNIVWHGDLISTTELVSIVKEKGYIVKSHIIGEADGIPLIVQYELKIDMNWVIQSVFLHVEADHIFHFSFQKDDRGNWHDANGKMLNTLNGCTDIDISLTPFTNSLPINRLKLKEGMSEEITVLYFDVPQQEFRPVQQRYTNLGNGFYKYEGLETGFHSIIETDKDGLVINYPGIWQRVYPKPQVQVKQSFQNALIADRPSTDLGDEASLYGWLIGEWDVIAHDHLADGTQRIQDGEWLFSWVLEGRAIQDVWIAPRRSGRIPGTPKAGNRYGTSLRIYYPASRQWKVYWHNPVSGAFNELTAVKEGNDIVQTGIDANGNQVRWVFTDIRPDSFHWYGESSTDEGETWKLESEFFGKKKR